MNQYPINFEVNGKAKSGVLDQWSCKANDINSSLAIPSSFGGSNNGLSPEDLYCMALLNCFVGTFKVYAQNSKLNYDEMKFSAKLSVDQDEHKKIIMKEFDAQVEIIGVDNKDKAMLLAKKAASSGFILNSVKTQCKFNFVIS